MTNYTVLTERRGNVLLITLNRPDAMNAIDTDLTHGLLAALAELESDPEIAVGVLTGTGRGFCAGMDLKAFAESGPPPGFDRLVQDSPSKPLIAAIEGFALAGGLELALICDLIVSARGAKFGIPETSVGLFAARGGLFRLPRRVPYGVAMEMALTAQPITAEQAHEYGLVTRLADPGEAVATALALAERIAANAPLAVAVSKRLIRELAALSEQDAWKAQEPDEDQIFASDDALEGSLAFAEKRPPSWSGK